MKDPILLATCFRIFFILLLLLFSLIAVGVIKVKQNLKLKEQLDDLKEVVRSLCVYNHIYDQSRFEEFLCMSRRIPCSDDLKRFLPLFDNDSKSK